MIKKDGDWGWGTHRPLVGIRGSGGLGIPTLWGWGAMGSVGRQGRNYLFPISYSLLRVPS
ncbi:hypothetical protein CEN44_27910 [Fischerella muscicola CCMEE 5323]|uniref:Uncharacterized protein n=1 Tax=Fischerella muscicola CCMEE 5323 TaxID=2019572 RepID=A0A2N6JUU7_FISMU|nr:hypothetical protein CEN44_27910 [Fischerella muscicola CCMEE 5323]